VTASIGGLEISEGTAYSNDDGGKGGGIFNAGSLSLNNCAVGSNGANCNYDSDFGLLGGNAFDDGIYSTDSLVLTDRQHSQRE
jgi:hypothetical protein